MAPKRASARRARAAAMPEAGTPPRGAPSASARAPDPAPTPPRRQARGAAREERLARCVLTAGGATRAQFAPSGAAVWLEPSGAAFTLTGSAGGAARGLTACARSEQRQRLGAALRFRYCVAAFARSSARAARPRAYLRGEQHSRMGGGGTLGREARHTSPCERGRGSAERVPQKLPTRALLGAAARLLRTRAHAHAHAAYYIPGGDMRVRVCIMGSPVMRHRGGAPSVAITKVKDARSLETYFRVWFSG